MRTFSLPIAIALAIAACSPGANGAGSGAALAEEDASATQVHPESGLKIVPLTVRTRNGEQRFAAELADTPDAQARGLMFRTELGPNEAMIFPFPAPRQASFWMRNTVIPLDIIFIGPDRRILNIAANTVPYSEERILSEGPASAVLELAGGRAAELGIAPGDRVAW